MRAQLKRSLALLMVLGLAACSSNSSSSTPSVIPPQKGVTILNQIVGVGDSLTAGTQSGVTMGEPGTNPLSPYPGHATPPTQENGFFAILYAQAKLGGNPLALYNPATSPLPLIHQPGVGNQLLLSATGQPFTTQSSSCDAFNSAAFSISGAASTVRIAPQAVTDLGVPGITAHEALYMTQPLTGPASQANGCVYPSIPGDPTSGPLQTVVDSESAMFYPVLGQYSATVSPLTQVNVAVSLGPTLSTVWLGANDILKYTFSNGQAPVDSPSQMQADITQTIKKLQAAGSKVVVANLPDVLSDAQFFAGGVPANPAVPSQTVFYYLQALTKGAISPAVAAAITGPTGPLQTQYGVSGAGYVTESGLFTMIAQLSAGQAVNLDPAGAGSGKGQNYIPDTLAATVHGLNAAYNGAIGAAASATSAPLVDIHAAFVNIVQSGGMTLSNGQTVSLRFGAGLVSFDGLHPSNVGYAVIADAWIGTIDTAFGLTIPQVDPANYYATDPYRIPGI